MQWFLTHLSDVIVTLLAIETALARLFPNVGFFKQADGILKAIEQADQSKP